MGGVSVSPAILEELLSVVGVFGRGYVDEVASAERCHWFDEKAADDSSWLVDHFVISFEW